MTQLSSSGHAFIDTADSATACPLCGARRYRPVAEYSYDAIWTDLRELYDLTFSDEVILRHTPQPTTSLHECTRCGLQYFTHCQPGDASFYSELTRSVPYAPASRWEFDMVARRVRGVSSLIDLGCGDGDFLRVVRTRSPKTRLVGVDHNAEAIAELRAQGIEGHATDVVNIAEEGRESFDAVCLFQTLEHVPDPLSLVRAAKQLMSPNGRLFLAVPNRNRMVRLPRDPLDCPPHHLTRWTPEQLADMAGCIGLTLDTISFEPPARWSLREPQRRRAERLSSHFGPMASYVVRRINNKLQHPRWWHALQVRRGVYVRRGLFGHSVLAELSRAR